MNLASFVPSPFCRGVGPNRFARGGGALVMSIFRCSQAFFAASQANERELAINQSPYYRADPCRGLSAGTIDRRCPN
jgi:hypothetical protein